MSNRAVRVSTQLLAMAAMLLLPGCSDSGEPKRDQTTARVPEPAVGGGSLAGSSGGAALEPGGLHLAIDVSGSMAGFAAGNGCYDRLWTEVFEAARATEWRSSFRSWTVGDHVSLGPDLGEVAGIRKFADPSQYPHSRSAVVEFLRFGDAFASAGPSTVVAFVSDLEPDMDNPLPGCAGNGSVTCLQEELAKRVSKGWALAVVGFESPFTGKRYFPEFKADGTVNSNAFIQLSGRKVPVYALIASRSPASAFAFAGRLVEEVARACTGTRPRTLRLTNLEGPAGTFSWEKSLESVMAYRDRGSGNLVATGEVALRRKSTDGKRITLKVYEDSLSVRFDLPFAARFPGSGDANDGLAWEYRLEHSVGVTEVADDAAVAVDLFPKGADGRAGVEGRATVTLSRNFLRAAAKSSGPALVLTLRAVPKRAGDPWADWSYHDAGQPAHELKTFRTAEVLGSILDQSVAAVNSGFAVTELELVFTAR